METVVLILCEVLVIGLLISNIWQNVASDREFRKAFKQNDYDGNDDDDDAEVSEEE